MEISANKQKKVWALFMPLQIDLMTDRENKLVCWYEYLEDIGAEQYFLLTSSIIQVVTGLVG